MMTTTVTPPPATPEPAPPARRHGFYVSPWVLAVLGGLVLLAIGFAVGRLVDRDDHGDRPFFRGGDGGGGHRGIGLLILIVVVALIVTGIVLLVRHYSASRHEVEMRDAALREPVASAEQVLADRFARGEINEAEFVSRRNTLRS
jgi:putative membrane protein